MEAQRAQDYARSVFREMCVLRGLNPKKVPADIRDDVFKVMDKFTGYYTRAFADGLDPTITARTLTHMNWEAS